MAALAALIMGGEPAFAAPASPADCASFAALMQQYAALTGGFYHSAESLMLTSGPADRFSPEVSKSLAALAASRDAMLPAMADFMASMKTATDALQACAAG